MEGIQLTAALCLESSLPSQDLLVPALFLLFFPYNFILLYIFHPEFSGTAVCRCKDKLRHAAFFPRPLARLYLTDK